MKVSVAFLFAFLGCVAFAQETTDNYSTASVTALFKDIAKHGCGSQFTPAQRNAFNACLVKNQSKYPQAALTGMNGKCKQYLSPPTPATITLSNAMPTLCGQISGTGTFTPESIQLMKCIVSLAPAIPNPAKYQNCPIVPAPK